VPNAGDDVVRPAQRGGEPAPDQAARSRDQNALAQPPITAPPLTQSTSPQM
jgi:hypothetical protein